MLKRWIIYISTLAGCLIFWAAHRGWIAWALLTVILCLPWFSLVISLVPMLTTRPGLSCPAAMDMGVQTPAVLTVKSFFPQLPYRCKLTLTHTLTGQTRKLPVGQSLPSGHCGQLLLRCSRFWVYDYLGLFALPLTRVQSRTVLVRPAPVSMEAPRGLQNVLSTSWQPKPGGGFAENHEMRLYRPGDSLNQIHWKLTAKTGRLTVREAMVPRYGKLLLTLDVRGTAAGLDRKMGRLVWLGDFLLARALQFELHALTGHGLLQLRITCRADLDRAMDQLLRSSPVHTGTARDTAAAAWHFHIGGDTDEA